MGKRGANISLASYDDIFSIEETRKESSEEVEKVQEIALSDLYPFKDHPFKVLDNEDMQKTVESIEKFGVLTPAIVRPREEGGYEIVSGHRRHHACELAGLQTMPAIVRNLDDDAAVILMVDSNLSREEILPSERAFAFKMKMEALKHQGERRDLTSDQVGPKLSWAQYQLAEEANSSTTQVKRFIRLTELLPELMDMVDNKKLGLNPAVEISYLTKENQKNLLYAMDYAQAIPSLSQAQRMKKMQQAGLCTKEALCAIMSEEKKSDLDRVTIKNEVLKKYFPKSYTPKQMEDTIIKLLEQWQRKQNHKQEL
ncbi:ParB/RepB/Spo0J family partition protein [Butyrivibrio sp. VCB2006]|uniref:ParB/RepB/Spo0J family partition protein n=1 Tax=Butyrivibrio sp. VCB2006 TaxID=1280679 RepID=UPI00041CAF23|nr:ParB/RepB/Spo0J family partition protein [Butyrivibrio sp. VCB2006]